MNDGFDIRDEFLALILMGESFREAASALGMKSSYFYNLRNPESPEYDDDFAHDYLLADAIRITEDEMRITAEAIKRAMERDT